ncbi:MAG: class Ib ribonucleoside-diphosphate reductase assembly flavoprotein NrdI [Atopobiaceae bacterium]|nr:class Ib ribonucleoside-diphosphate reductase assembly flavoprotein NrdI [Atopobiaceae bacterium]
MKVAYASRTGNVEAVVEKLGITDAVKIEDGTETIEGEYIVMCYTDGKGIVPEAVEAFLKANPGVKGVVASGNSERHADTFCWAADIISKEYGVPTIAKLDKQGTDEDLDAIRAALD